MNTNTKNWITSKTLWVAILQGIVGVFTVLSTTPEFQGVGYLLIIKSVLDGYLRSITEAKLK